MKKFFITLSLVIFISFNMIDIVSAKNSTEGFQNISIENGLSSVYINTIFQCSKGYIWIGTTEGLNRYNGSNIKVYNHEIGNNNSLSSTWITAIEEDLDGNLWIGTTAGIDILNTTTDEITRANNYNEASSAITNSNITAILRDSDGCMWIGSENGLAKIDKKNNTYEIFNKRQYNSLIDNNITDLEEDNEGNLWIGTKEGLNAINIKGNRVLDKEVGDKENSTYVYNLEKDLEGNMWLATKDGLIKYDISKKRFKDVGINIGEYSNTIPKKIFCDSNNNIWISGSNGAIKYSNEYNSIKIYSVDDKERKSIASNTVYCYFEDKNGELWIGTNNGVSILSNIQQFGIMNSNIFNDENSDALIGKNITAIYEDSDGDIWVGTNETGVNLIFADNSGKVNFSCDLGTEKSLSNNSVKSITEYEKGRMIVTTEKGVNVIYKDTLEVKVYDTGEEYLREANYVCIDSDDVMWYGSNEGLFSYDKKTDEFKNHDNIFYENDILDMCINFIYNDPNNHDILWLGGNTNAGLIRFNKSDGTIKRYIHNLNDSNSISNNAINCIESDNEGNLWIGTRVGLNKFNIDTEVFTNYIKSSGLPNNYIQGIVVDENNDIWVSTNYGISKFYVKENRFINYTEMDGLQGNKFNSKAYLKTTTGHIFFGGTHGITYFYPSDIKEPEYYYSEVIIDDIYVNDNKVIYDGEELVLSHKDNNISFEYFFPNYEKLNSIKYKFMLEGVDKEWTYVDNRSFANYTLLSPGKYVFKVVAINSYGRVTEEAKVNIRIKNPFWKTTIANILYIILISMIVYYLYNQMKILKRLVKNQTKELNSQMEKNKKLYEENIKNEKFKNTYFVNLSHELRTPINVILSTTQLITMLSKESNLTKEKHNEYMRIIKKSSNNLLKVINDIIDSSKIEAGAYKINKEKDVDIVYLVEETALTMSEYIEAKDISLIIDPEIEEKSITCDPTEIERCIINLLGNASKFTDAGGIIKVLIKDNDDTVEIIIEDTGRGISKEDQQFIFNRFAQGKSSDSTKVSSSGIGLALVKNIVNLHGGNIRLESEIDKGSKFTITLPVA